MKNGYPRIQPYFRISINRIKDIHKSNYGYPIFVLRLYFMIYIIHLRIS